MDEYARLPVWASVLGGHYSPAVNCAYRDDLAGRVPSSVPRMMKMALRTFHGT